MLLKKLDFVEFVNNPRFWHLEKMEFGQINLIVGKNSSGKSRVLAVINILAKLLGGKIPAQFDNGTWDVTFNRTKGLSSEEQRYRLALKNSSISYESLTIKDQTVLEREASGEGFVIKRKTNDKVKYKVTQNQLMAVVRRDEYQHPQLDHLYTWGHSLCFYRFGSEFGKDMAAAINPTSFNEQAFEISSLAENPVTTFQTTEKKFGKAYTDLILEDMDKLGYPCDEISLCPIAGLNIGGATPLILQIKEKNLECYTTQQDMSQGMYRAFALSTYINANILWTQASMIGRTPLLGDSPMIVIDDIGEGLDHSRSRALIKLLIEKAQKHNIQLIMSSNDRYIMNDVPLEYWNVLHRNGPTVKSFNISNSKEKFEEFEYSGLSNFDFFSNEYFLPDQK